MIQTLKSLFRPASAAALHQRLLEHTERELVHAEADLEHVLYQRDMLQARLKRLSETA